MHYTSTVFFLKTIITKIRMRQFCFTIMTRVYDYRVYNHKLLILIIACPNRGVWSHNNNVLKYLRRSKIKAAAEMVKYSMLKKEMSISQLCWYHGNPSWERQLSVQAGKVENHVLSQIFRFQNTAPVCGPVTAASNKLTIDCQQSNAVLLSQNTTWAAQ